MLNNSLLLQYLANPNLLHYPNRSKVSIAPFHYIRPILLRTHDGIQLPFAEFLHFSKIKILARPKKQTKKINFPAPCSKSLLRILQLVGLTPCGYLPPELTATPLGRYYFISLDAGTPFVNTVVLTSRWDNFVSSVSSLSHHVITSRWGDFVSIVSSPPHHCRSLNLVSRYVLI